MADRWVILYAAVYDDIAGADHEAAKSPVPAVRS